MGVDRKTLLAWIKPSPATAEELQAAASLLPGDCEIYVMRFWPIERNGELECS